MLKYIILKPDEMYRKEAFRIALAFALGVLFMNVFNIEEGHWIIFSLAFIFLGGCAHGFLAERTLKIVIGTVTGLFFGLIYLVLLSFNLYVYSYLVPIFFFLAFYLYFLNRMDYFYLAFFISAYLLVLNTITAPVYMNYNLANTIFSMGICAVIGGGIHFVTNSFIFKSTSKPKETTLPILKNIHVNCINVFESVNANFVKSRFIEGMNVSKLVSILDEMKSIGNLSETIAHELNFVKDNANHYKKFMNHCELFVTSIKKMTLISNHKFDEPLGSEIVIKFLEKVKFIGYDNFDLSKEFIKVYETSGIKIREESTDFLYLKNVHSALWNMNRIKKQINFIEMGIL